MQDPDALERQLERVGGDLRQRGLEPLPQHRGADIDGDRAVVLDRGPRVLLARAAALHERHGGEPVIASVDQAALQRLLLRPADLGERALEGRVIVAGVEIGLALVGHELAGGERQLGLADQVLAAELHRVEAEVARDHVEQPLAKEVRLEPPGRAHRADRRLAGHQRFDGDGDVADAVGARQELRRLRRHHAAVGADIGAHVAVDVAAQAEDARRRACRRSRGRNRPRASDWSPSGARGGPRSISPAGRHGGPRTGSGNPRDRTRRARRSRRRRRRSIMSMALSATPSIGASVRRLKNSTLVAPNTVSFAFAASHSAIRPRVSSGNAGQAVTAKALPAGVLGLGEGRVGIAERDRIAHRAVAAARLEQQRRRRSPPRGGPAPPAAARCRRRSPRARPRPAPGCRPRPRRSARRHSAPCPWRSPAEDRP